MDYKDMKKRLIELEKFIKDIKKIDEKSISKEEAGRYIKALDEGIEESKAIMVEAEALMVEAMEALEKINNEREKP